MIAIYKYILLTTALLLSACGIMEDTTDCPQGIEISFYSQTACALQRSYPAEISELRMYLFDERGVLAAIDSAPEVSLAADYTYTAEASNGLYTVVAWAGVDAETFDMSTPQVGVTTKDDVLFSLRNTGGRALSFNNHRVYYGESEAVNLPDPAIYGSVFKQVSVNLREQTNRITVEVEGLPRADDYEVAIETKMGAMCFGGGERASPQMEYLPVARLTSGVLTASLTVMELTTGFDTELVVRHRQRGTELYRGDLLGTLLLKNPNVNLACDNDFVIRFTTNNQNQNETYTITEIWVNNWLVHSYETEL
ncbi:MAG: FimB/Mfa2 family fimbrial subunit [Rikenellaceae bacterium]|jgi:hypothetical protein|nr:FimB/Mfa2 family fimbrial subunit [Rikenellaceae bacterium]